jgi:inhibitor of cysteine peptidase
MATTPVPITPKFEVEKFASCQEMEDTMIDILERYQSRYWYPYPMYARDIAMPTDGVRLEKASVASPAPAANVWAGTNSVGPVSTTNTQVLGVDEADTVKTDGTNLYSYSEESREVRIVRASDLSLVTTIKLPETFSSINMYLARGRLILVGSKYITTGARWDYRWYAPESKSLVAVYNMTTPTKPVLERYSQIDGDYRESRLINDTLYMVSSSYLRMPPIYYTSYAKMANGWDQAVTAIDKNFSLKTITPEIRENIRNSRTGRYLQSIRSSVANCKDVTFVLPDDATLKNIDFSPSFVSLSSVNIADPTARMKSQLLFGDVSQIHMSQTALYITSVISSSSPDSSCPPGAECLAKTSLPIWGGSYRSSTLVHKYTLSAGTLTYKYSTTVDGNPMNQYSMDEDASGNFRLVTQNYAWSSDGNENTTELNIIGTNGKVIGSLKNIAPGENFQSARFIGNRLYLVTFEQIDPFFVIDLSTPTSPKILWELKIPGYSTYLHPYDDNRLIWLGYDTKTNQWGGTQNGWLKVDLYNVSDVKNPRQESSLILGDAGSSSEVLHNPRAFVWYKEKNLLLLPATLMKSASDPQDIYRAQSAFQGIVGVSITPSNINEKFRVTHISVGADAEKKWKEECARYSGTGNSCRTLIDGSTYCGGGTTWVPPYCYAGSTVDTYLASNLWNYQRDFITRALYVGEKFYSLGEGGIKSWNFTNTASPTASITFASNPIKTPIYPVPMMAK